MAFQREGGDSPPTCPGPKVGPGSLIYLWAGVFQPRWCSDLRGFHLVTASHPCTPGSPGVGTSEMRIYSLHWPRLV